MLTQLRAIFDIIVEFQAKQSRMYTECVQEMELRQQYNATEVAHTEKVRISHFIANLILILCNMTLFFKICI